MFNFFVIVFFCWHFSVKHKKFGTAKTGRIVNIEKFPLEFVSSAFEYLYLNVLNFSTSNLLFKIYVQGDYYCIKSKALELKRSNSKYCN